MTPRDDHPLIGRQLDELDTPVLIVDLACFEANVAHLAATCSRLGLNWRPHAKGHKSIAVAHRLLAAGARRAASNRRWIFSRSTGLSAYARTLRRFLITSMTSMS